MDKEKCELQFAVLGLGRFGMSIVKTLAEYDANILACDRDPARLHEATEYAAHVVQADAADEDAMHKLGLGNFDVVVLAMGEDFEASVIAAMLAKELGAGKVVAKAFGTRQKKILESIGVDQVVLPEVEMGAKVARNLVNPNVLDVLEQTGRQTIAEMCPRDEWVGKTIGEADIRKRYGYTILAIVRGEETIIPVTTDIKIQKEDILVTLSKHE
ncbi:TrkA family potassium uptake protein [Ruminococcaceae bacterium OttesenSCG-928-D13]|nr:TrkA family potassium uptake protein [Ruminococcaceae bacterium OttesenSCG-928-D13]MDL2327823.1 TrkA family potassium uptake protein [Ruminococcaceae bacterium OttesenSCG-928-A11]